MATFADGIIPQRKRVSIIWRRFLFSAPVNRSPSDWKLEICKAYNGGILSPNFYDDGLHIALATVARADLLVSWNFKHIIHFDKIRLFNAVNIEFGYKPLQIFSPREVTTYGR